MVRRTLRDPHAREDDVRAPAPGDRRSDGDEDPEAAPHRREPGVVAEEAGAPGARGAAEVEGPDDAAYAPPAPGVGRLREGHVGLVASGLGPAQAERAV